MQKTIARIITVMTLVLLWQSEAFQQTKYKIVIIPKGSTQYFWKAVQTGVNAEAKTLKDIEVIWKAPTIESDKKEQISIVENCIQEGVSGIILSPIDKYELAASVGHAGEKKIPVLIFDSALEKYIQERILLRLLAPIIKKVEILQDSIWQNYSMTKGR